MHGRYDGILEEGKKRGIVEEKTNLYDEYFAGPATRNIREVPYLEGDFWVDEAEKFLGESRKSCNRRNGSDGDGVRGQGWGVVTESIPVWALPQLL